MNPHFNGIVANPMRKENTPKMKMIRILVSNKFMLVGGNSTKTKIICFKSVTSAATDKKRRHLLKLLLYVATYTTWRFKSQKTKCKGGGQLSS